MKKSILILSLFIVAFGALAQTEKAFDISVKHPTGSKLSGFLEYIPYSMTVHVGDTIADFWIRGDENSSVIKETDSTYKVIFHGRQYRSIITGYTQVNDEDVPLFCRRFNFRAPTLTPLIQKRNFSGSFLPGSTISKEDLKQSFISVGVINYDLTVAFNVMSYSVLIPVNGTFEKHEVIGNQLDDTVREYIDGLQSGQPIIFKNIWIAWCEDYEWLDLIIYVE